MVLFNETSSEQTWTATSNLTRMSQPPDLSEVNEAGRNFEKTITAPTCDPRRGGRGGGGGEGRVGGPTTREVAIKLALKREASKRAKVSRSGREQRSVQDSIVFSRHGAPIHNLFVWATFLFRQNPGLIQFSNKY